jgi:hypothetical protein
MGSTELTDFNPKSAREIRHGSTAASTQGGSVQEISNCPIIAEKEDRTSSQGIGN